jgi:hypothetical protein
MKITQTAAFLAKMAKQRIHTHAGGAKALVHLHLSGRHLCPECHLCHVMKVSKFKAQKLKASHLNMGIYLLHFPALDFLILNHMPMIAGERKILFQIC